VNYTQIGDCRETMRAWHGMGIKAQMCVTSPPYFGLRDYGHEGQLGLEPTPDEYVAKMVEVFRAVRDVLADDGTLWLNLGDSYAPVNYGANSKRRRDSATAADSMQGKAGHWHADRDGPRSADVYRGCADAGLKHKDLIGIPWMVAFALRADGWYLRQDIIWHKPNPMPESVTDRCTKAHEYLFMLSKSPRYYFDSEAMQEPSVKGAAGSNFHTGKTGDHQLGRASTKPRSKADSFKRGDSKRAAVIPGQSLGTHRADRDESDYPLETRNRRSVWTVATRPYKGAHFATFPPALIEPCILAGSRPGDVVLDPFMGSGTTAMVATQHGRQYLGCELNPEYVALQEARLSA